MFEKHLLYSVRLFRYMLYKYRCNLLGESNDPLKKLFLFLTLSFYKIFLVFFLTTFIKVIVSLKINYVQFTFEEEEKNMKGN